MDRKELFESFKKRFPGYDEEHDFKVGEDGSWIFAVIDRETVAIDKDREGFHYELVLRGSDEFYVELHFELYKYQWPDMRNALVKVLNQEKYRREIIATSYYSSLIWRVRRPVFNGDDISNALCWLSKAVSEAAAQAKGLVNDKRAEVVESVKPDEEIKSAALILPGPCSIAAIAQMLIEGAKDENTQDKRCNRLVIPSVQRGKVWNAARIETLWDSIFRNIPIGALSIRKRINDPTAYDLLDGQQRATAIALGYDSFPDCSRKYESILWIDLKKLGIAKKEIRYGFFVTTASQPWGYADSNNETKNNLLSEWEKREASKVVPDAQWEEGQSKPYPSQLFPVNAKLPVPYTLLREYAESKINNGGVKFNEFLEFIRIKNLNKCLLCKLGAAVDCHDCNQFASGDSATVDDSIFGKLCEKVVNISKDYKVFLLDASSVAENDIALYFTRIGKGGVVPSDEELAYSVLKSKLGPDFRETIQSIHNDYGLASESRIAHLAIRLFKSESNEEKSSRPQFYSGSVFSAVMDMCKEENAAKKQAFAEFITGKFKERIELVKKKYELTQWHSARYASERNGDVYLLLLLAAGKDDLFAGYDIRGLAELLYGYASHIDSSVRKIFEEGVPIALANLTKETYYGKPRLILPMSLERLKDVPLDSIASLLKWKDSYPETAQTMAEGYYNSSYDHAFNILLYSCRSSKKNNHFKYDRNLGLWAEDNCPWDYDHIMPHSTIEKMPDSDSDAKRVCEWLKNSMGNLAPLPFSLNRSWSDAARKANYPCEDSDEQKALCIDDGASIGSMWDNKGQISPIDFCKMVIARYHKIYKRWYEELGIGKILDFKSALTSESPTQDVWRAAKHRYSIFTQVASSLPDWTYKRIVADNKESKISEYEMYKEFCSDQVITLSMDVKKDVSVALSKCGIHGVWKVGLRKSSGDSSTSRKVFEQVKALDADLIDKSKIQNENERWWYWYDEIKDTEDVNVEEIVKILKSLHRAIGKIP